MAAVARSMMRVSHGRATAQHARCLASAEAVRRRQPEPDSPRGARVTYRGGISRSKGSELVGGFLQGRWRGTTIDLNFDHQVRALPFCPTPLARTLSAHTAT